MESEDVVAEPIDTNNPVRLGVNPRQEPVDSYGLLTDWANVPDLDVSILQTASTLSP